MNIFQFFTKLNKRSTKGLFSLDQLMISFKISSTIMSREEKIVRYRVYLSLFNI